MLMVTDDHLIKYYAKKIMKTEKFEETNFDQNISRVATYCTNS